MMRVAQLVKHYIGTQLCYEALSDLTVEKSMIICND